jgi:hypothetical protein
MNGTPERQDYLETVIKWISMIILKNIWLKNNTNQTQMKFGLYFQCIISWVKATFPKYRKEMKGIVWGFFTTSSKTKNLTTKNLNYK